MSVGAPDAADVPSLFDVIINGKGYIFLRTIDTSLPFRTQRAKYSRTQTFLERSNTTGAYGDDQQAFFLTESQHNWAIGEQQKFYLPTDTDGQFRFWKGSNLDVSVPGQASLQPTALAKTPPLNPICAVADSIDQIWFFDTTKSYAFAGGHFSTSSGVVHGMSPTVGTGFCAADPADGKIYFTDGSVVKLLTTSAGESSSYSAFSASGSGPMVVANQALYGFAGGALVTFSTAGVRSVVFQFKNASGTSTYQTCKALARFGGKILILFDRELWQYDGTNTSLQAEFPKNFVASGMVVEQGITYIAGQYFNSLGEINVVWSWDGNTLTVPWEGVVSGTNYPPAIARYNGGLLIHDTAGSRLLYYNPSTGSVNGIYDWATATNSGATFIATAKTGFGMFDTNSTSISYFPRPSTIYATSGSLETGLLDFSNTLTKLFRGIKVDWVAGTDGDGGSVDISYQVDSVDGAYTSLQTSAASGTEYLITGASGRAIGAKITLNKGTSTYGPVLKRVYVRAAPLLQSFRSNEYILDCSGVDSKTPVILNDNETAHPKDGLGMATDLQAAVVLTSPFTVTDRFGSFTAVIEPDQTEFIEIAPEEYIVRVNVREV